MKRYSVYRNIRKKALIYGLPLGSFALMIVFIIGTLLVIIFSFSLPIVAGGFVLNLGVYILMIHLAKNPFPIHFTAVFPTTISNKKLTGLYYED